MVEGSWAGKTGRFRVEGPPGKWSGVNDPWMTYGTDMTPTFSRVLLFPNQGPYCRLNRLVSPRPEYPRSLGSWGPVPLSPGVDDPPGRGYLGG